LDSEKHGGEVVNQCAIHIEPAGSCYRVFLTDWAGYQLGYTPEHMHPTLVASEHKARAIGANMAQAAGIEVVAYLIGTVCTQSRTKPAI